MSSTRSVAAWILEGCAIGVAGLTVLLSPNTAVALDKPLASALETAIWTASRGVYTFIPVVKTADIRPSAELLNLLEQRTSPMVSVHAPIEASGLLNSEACNESFGLLVVDPVGVSRLSCGLVESMDRVRADLFYSDPQISTVPSDYDPKLQYQVVHKIESVHVHDVSTRGTRTLLLLSHVTCHPCTAIWKHLPESRWLSGNGHRAVKLDLPENNPFAFNRPLNLFHSCPSSQGGLNLPLGMIVTECGYTKLLCAGDEIAAALEAPDDGVCGGGGGESPPPLPADTVVPSWLSPSLAGAGIGMLGAATILAIRAQDLDDASQQFCRATDHTACNSAGVALRDQALGTANAATVTLVLGASLMTAGAALWLMPISSSSTGDSAASLYLVPSGLSVRGQW